VKGLDLIRKGKIFKNHRSVVTKIYGKNKPTREILKKVKEINATFAVTPQVAKLQP
jgi:hypothetical protein